ncbi:MAG: rubredoxin [Thermoplasmata archaeon]|nr:rubredoxin [Thermoplasmata archaeon]
MQKMKCTICGWIYDPEAGTPSQDVEPGTPWDEVDPEFRCPKCGAAKKWFEAI